MEKRIVFFLLIFSLTLTHLYSDEEVDDSLSSELDESPTFTVKKPKNEVAKKNWIFAGATLIAASLGFYVVVIDQGHRAH